MVQRFAGACDLGHGGFMRLAVGCHGGGLVARDRAYSSWKPRLSSPTRTTPTRPSWRARRSVKGVPALVSIVLGGDGSVRARVWKPDRPCPLTPCLFSRSGAGSGDWAMNGAAGTDHLERQARLFGPSFNPLLRGLRIAVVGLGGTGSAVAMLLARLGVGHLLLIDDDIVETTNLNRIHGSRRVRCRSASDEGRTCAAGDRGGRPRGRGRRQEGMGQRAGDA